MRDMVITFQAYFLLQLVTLLSLPTIFSKNTHVTKPFVAVWNVPTQDCFQRYGIFLNFCKFGIDTNKEQRFYGENIVLVYEPRPGLYPRYLKNGTQQNGGLPQNTNLKHHLLKADVDIKSLIPDVSYHGMSVIDWESWRPIFERNLYDKPKHVYVTETQREVQRSHPDWSKAKVKAESQEIFETAARMLMETTLKEGKQLRPSGKWGFYGFPRCFNFEKGEKYCANDTVMYNDRLYWLFAASSALYPSIYLDTEVFPSPADRKSRVHGILGESLRVHNKYMDRQSPIYAYTTFRYRNMKMFYKKVDLEITIQESFDAGLDGVVLWDSSTEFVNKSDCTLFSRYLESQLGPFLLSVINFATTCSKKLCNSHGKCVNQKWNTTEKTENMRVPASYTSQSKLTFSSYRCQCYYPYTGKYCQQVILKQDKNIHLLSVLFPPGKSMSILMAEGTQMSFSLVTFSTLDCSRYAVLNSRTCC